MRPTPQCGHPVLQQRVAFGVRQDDAHPGVFQFLPHPAGVRKDHHVGEFHQQVGPGVDGVARGVRERVLDVVQHEVEIAAAHDPDALAHALLRRGKQRSTFAGSNLYWVSACGEATMAVVPVSRASRNSSTVSSMVSAPSSRPGRMWLWISIIYRRLPSGDARDGPIDIDQFEDEAAPFLDAGDGTRETRGDGAIGQRPDVETLLRAQHGVVARAIDLEVVEEAVQVVLRDGAPSSSVPSGSRTFKCGLADDEEHIGRIVDAHFEHGQRGCLVGRDQARLQDPRLQPHPGAAGNPQHQRDDQRHDGAGDQQVLDEVGELELGFLATALLVSSSSGRRWAGSRGPRPQPTQFIQARLRTRRARCRDSIAEQLAVAFQAGRTVEDGFHRRR